MYIYCLFTKWVVTKKIKLKYPSRKGCKRGGGKGVGPHCHLPTVFVVLALALFPFPFPSPRPFRPRRPRVVSLSSTLDPPYEQGLVVVVAGLPCPHCGHGCGCGCHPCPSPVPCHPVGAPTTPTQADACCGGVGAGLVPLFPCLGSLPPFSLLSSRHPSRHHPPIVVVPSFSLSSPCSRHPLVVVVPVPGRRRPVIVVSRFFTRYLKICW